MIKQYRHFCRYIFVSILSYLRCNDIRRELVNKASIIKWSPILSARFLAIISGYVYCQSDITFSLLLCYNWAFIVYTGVFLLRLFSNLIL